MEKCQAGVVGDEVYLCFLIAAQHQNIFQDTCSRLSGDAGQLKTVS